MMFIISSQQVEEIAFVPLKKKIIGGMHGSSINRRKRKGNEEYMMGNIGAVTT